MDKWPPGGVLGVDPLELPDVNVSLLLQLIHLQLCIIMSLGEMKK